MSAVMESVGTRPTASTKAAMPPALKVVVERHLEGLVGLPTPEIVAAICKDPAASSHKEKVLKYFLIESPLRAEDLGTLLCGIGQNSAKLLCQKAATERNKRFVRGKKPRWEEAKPS